MFSSAWAAPCSHQAPEHEHMVMSASMDEPCHDMARQGQHNCEGICLCMHIALQSTSFIHQSDIIFDRLYALSTQEFIVMDEQVSSISIAPPRRPPRFIA